MRDIPDENHPHTCREARLRRWVSEGQDWAEDVWEKKILHQSVGALHQEHASLAGWQWHDDKTTLPPPTHPTKDNVHLGIFSNVRFSPKFADGLSTERLEETHESFGPRSLLFSANELPHWLSMKSQESLDEDHYKHLVLGSYAGMLGDLNYINTIVRQKGKTTGCKCKIIHEDGTVSSMDNGKTRCEGTCERSIVYRSQSWRREADPIATRWLSSWRTHGSRGNSFVISWGSSMLAINNRGEGWNTGSVINLWLKKSLILKEIRCRLMKVACWEHIVWSTLSFLRM